MYQTNIPMLYVELEKKNARQMNKVMAIGTVGATVLYIMAGVFGYAAFALNPELDRLMKI
jgi:amino acid permease